MNQDNDKALPLSTEEDRLVDIRGLEMEVSEHDLHQLSIPPMPGLFQAIQGFAEVTDKVLVAWGSEARGLGYVDDLVCSE